MDTARLSPVILVDDRGWLLLQERDSKAAYAPDKWGMVGGHAEAGEGFEAAAYRELAEETGVSLDSGLDLWFDGVFTRENGEVAPLNVWVASTSLTDADVVLGEGRQIVFVDPLDVPTLDLAESARHFVLSFLDSSQYAALAGTARE